jgi:hypothetical protein
MDEARAPRGAARNAGERAGRTVIALAAFAALLLAAYHYGAGAGRPQPLPAKTWTHGVAFKLHVQRANRGD